MNKDKDEGRGREPGSEDHTGTLVPRITHSERVHVTACSSPNGSTHRRMIKEKIKEIKNKREIVE